MADTGTDSERQAGGADAGSTAANGSDAAGGPPDVSWSDDPTRTDDGGTAEPDSSVEPAPANRLRLIGVSLIASVVIGFAPLRDAIQGNGSFENAMLRFLLCFAACVLAASVLGRLLDGAPSAKPGEDEKSSVDGSSQAVTGQGSPSKTATASAESNNQDGGADEAGGL